MISVSFPMRLNLASWVARSGGELLYDLYSILIHSGVRE